MTFLLPLLGLLRLHCVALSINFSPRIRFKQKSPTLLSDFTLAPSAGLPGVSLRYSRDKLLAQICFASLHKKKPALAGFVLPPGLPGAERRDRPRDALRQPAHAGRPEDPAGGARLPGGQRPHARPLRDREGLRREVGGVSPPPAPGCAPRAAAARRS